MAFKLRQPGNYGYLPFDWHKLSGTIYGIRTTGGMTMFIKRNSRKFRGKIYEYGFLVTSIITSRGRRHKVLYSLGSLEGIKRENDGQLTVQLEKMISGQ